MFQRPKHEYLMAPLAHTCRQRGMRVASDGSNPVRTDVQFASESAQSHRLLASNSCFRTRVIPEKHLNVASTSCPQVFRRS